MLKDPNRRLQNGSELLAELDTLDQEVYARAPRSSLSGGEQRIVSILMAIDPYVELCDSEAATMPGSLIRARNSELWRTISELGSDVERLSDGSLVAQMSGKEAATDAAARAARLALTLRSRLPNMITVLATATGKAGGKEPVGEIIDQAAHLMQVERERVDNGGENTMVIRVDEATAGLLDTRFEIAGDDHGLTLRGEREPLVIERTLLGSRTPFVGRSRELGHLIATFEECIEDSVSRAILVTASAGMGKTRLCAEFLRRLPERERTKLLLARGEMVGAGSAYGLLAQGLRGLFGVREGEPLAVRRKKLHGKLARQFSGEEFLRVATFLGEPIGTRYVDEPSVQLAAAPDDAQLMADQMQLAWQTWIGRQCQNAPTVIVLDDLHWGDAATVRAIDATLVRQKDAPLMVLALARPEVHEQFPSLWSKRAVEYLNLNLLPKRAGARLVRSVLGASAGQDTIDQLVAQAEGNAFYLEELIRAAAEGNLAAPETVLAMIQARLAKLPAVARRILRAASVFGQTFWLGGTAGLLGAEGELERLRGRIEALVEAEFVHRDAVSRFDGAEQYAFNHVLVRDATYSTLTEQDRSLGHSLAGEWLARRGETDAAVLAEHFEKGGDLAKAAAWYVRAVQQALESNSLDDVHARAERGIACGAIGHTLGELRLARVQALIWQGSMEAALKDVVEVPQLFDPHTEPWYRAVSALAVVCGHMGARGPVVTTTEVLLSRPPTGISHAYAKALAVMGRTLLELGELTQLAVLRGVIHRARLGAEQSFRPWARLMYEIEMEKSTDKEIAAYTTTLDAWRQTGDRRHTCIEAINLAYLWTTIGAYERALPLLRQSLAEGESLGSWHLVAHAQNNLGCCLAKMGQFEEALEASAAAVAGHRELGARRLEITARVDLAYIHAKMGDLTRAEYEARTAIKYAEVMPRTRCAAMATLGMIGLLAGDCDKALAASQQAMHILNEFANNVPDGEAIARMVFAEALLANGEKDRARDAIETARTRLFERASHIENPSWADCFLYNVPEHARTLALAEEWTGRPAKVFDPA